METRHQKYYRLNKEKRDASSKAHRIKNREKYNEYSRKYGKLHKRIRPNWNSTQREKRRVMRETAVSCLGGKCVRCGFNDIRALQIDHINGGGAKERKERLYKKEYHKHVVESFLKQENKYQLLCANCNWIKRSENCEIRKV